MAAKASDVVSWIWYAYNNKFGYIWGTTWVVWTAAMQRAATREMTVKYGSQWIGHTVADCAGLLRGALKKCGENIHAGSNLIFDCDLVAHGQLQKGKRTDGKELLPASAVFTGKEEHNHPHVGMYVGDGIVIEAAGTREGVIKSSITDKKWTWWGELEAVDYGTEPGPEKKPTLKRGDSGKWVTLAQTELINQGYSCGSTGADGKFGKNTEAAVKRFQLDHGLTADGVIGEKTWEALDGSVPAATYTVTVPGLTATQADALILQYPGATKTEERS